MRIDESYNWKTIKYEGRRNIGVEETEGCMDKSKGTNKR